MILSNNLNIQFRDNGRVGVTAVLLDCRKGEVELWGHNVTRHLPTRGQKYGKCCRRIFAHFLSWISSRRSLLFFFQFLPYASSRRLQRGYQQQRSRRDYSSWWAECTWKVAAKCHWCSTRWLWHKPKKLFFFKTLHGELLCALLFRLDLHKIFFSVTEIKCIFR